MQYGKILNIRFCNAFLLASSPDVSGSSPFESWFLALSQPELKVLCCICMPPTQSERPTLSAGCDKIKSSSGKRKGLKIQRPR